MFFSLSYSYLDFRLHHRHGFAIVMSAVRYYAGNEPNVPRRRSLFNTVILFLKIAKTKKNSPVVNLDSCASDLSP